MEGVTETNISIVYGSTIRAQPIVASYLCFGERSSETNMSTSMWTTLELYSIVSSQLRGEML